MQVKVNLGSKISEIRTEKGLSQSQFASALGITQAQISNIEKDYRGVSPKIAARIKEKYDIDIYSFILAKEFSEEKKPIRDDKLKKLREAYNLTQGQLATKLGVSKALITAIENGERRISFKLSAAIQNIFKINILEEVADTVKSFSTPIPIYHIGAAAGTGTTVADSEPESDMLFFDERWLKNILGVNPKNLHLILASGDSMDSGFNQPTDIRDGDLLMVDTSQLEGNNKIYVILVNNSELRVKRLFTKLDGTLLISSTNTKYKEEIYYPDEAEVEIKVIGKVVWNGSKENI